MRNLTLIRTITLILLLSTTVGCGVTITSHPERQSEPIAATQSGIPLGLTLDPESDVELTWSGDLKSPENYRLVLITTDAARVANRRCAELAADRSFVVARQGEIYQLWVAY